MFKFERIIFIVLIVFGCDNSYSKQKSKKTAPSEMVVYNLDERLQAWEPGPKTPDGATPPMMPARALINKGVDLVNAHWKKSPQHYVIGVTFKIKVHYSGRLLFKAIDTDGREIARSAVDWKYNPEADGEYPGVSTYYHIETNFSKLHHFELSEE